MLAQVQGEPVVRAFTSDPVRIRSDVNMPTTGGPECQLPVGRLDFEWSFDLGLTLAGFPLDDKTKGTNTLYIAPNTMDVGNSYYFNVKALVQGYPELWNVAQAEVTAELSSPCRDLGAGLPSAED